MNMSSSFRFSRGFIALLGAWAVTAFAQQPPPAPETPAAPAERTPKADTPAADAAPAAEPASPTREPPLRRVDEPVTPTPPRQRTPRRYSSQNGPPFGDHYVTEGNRVAEAISILGSTTIDGEVSGDAVSVMGNTTVSPTGKVSGAAVAVLGRIEVKGAVRQEAVSVLGGTYIDGHVGQEVVCVLGDLELGPNAVIDGDLVRVGGSLKKDPRAIVNGNEVDVPLFFGPQHLDWLISYVRNCVMLARPLAFAPHLGWAWLVAFAFLGFYLLLALLFPAPLGKCVQTLETRPGASVLAAVLTVLLSPVAIVLLCFTVIGIVLVPFLVIGLMLAGLFGKATMLAWIGRRFTRFFGDGIFGHIFFAVLIGGLLVLVLYTVPVFGLLLLKLLGWLGLGVVVYTILVTMKRPKPIVVPVAAAAGPTGPTTMPMAVPDYGSTSAPVAPMTSATEPSASAPPLEPIPPAIGAMPAPPPPSFSPPAQPVLLASTLPRAGFFIRVGALLLDVILVALVCAFVSHLLPRAIRFDPPGFLPVLAAYAALMWKLKGTTIGGIVCGLKVVRVDNRPLDWATAIVRALGCFLSLVVVGLGFIWVAIDDEKQSWHDKIAGTVVVQVPKGVSLL